MGRADALLTARFVHAGIDTTSLAKAAILEKIEAVDGQSHERRRVGADRDENDLAGPEGHGSFPFLDGMTPARRERFPSAVTFLARPGNTCGSGARAKSKIQARKKIESSGTFRVVW